MSKLRLRAAAGSLQSLGPYHTVFMHGLFSDMLL